MLKINDSEKEGRYKVWLVKIYRKKKLFISEDIAEIIASTVFDRYKLSKQEDSQHIISYTIAGETRIRRRLRSVEKNVNVVLADSGSRLGMELDELCDIVITKANSVFEKLDIGSVTGSSEKSSEYKAKDILILDLHENRHPWQIKVLNMIYDESKEDFVEPDDRTIIWIFDPTGCTGKSKFVKWVCVNRPEEVAKVTFGTASQLRSAIISAGPRKCYFLDLPRTISSDDSLTSILGVIEDIKNGQIVSNMYGQHKQLLMDPPHIVIFANIKCPKQSLSEDRWKLFKINAKKLDLENFNF